MTQTADRGAEGMVAMSDSAQLRTASGIHGPTMTAGRRAQSAPAIVRFAELGSSVHLGSVPDGLADELPGLYGSLFSTRDWFLAYDRVAPNGACVLEEPRHVVLFRHEGDTVDVLNKVFLCPPPESERICRSIFRALPKARRIRMDVMFEPERLRLPKRVLYRMSRMVIELPDSVEEYRRSLGKSTRRNVRRYQSLLRRSFPDIRTRVMEPGPHSRAVVDRLVRWKIQRFRAKGQVTYWETSHDLVDRVSELLERCGTVRVTTIDGVEAALDICFRIGDTAYVYESAHDPRFDEFSLGFLTFYWLVADAIESGATRLDALEGSRASKALLGAQPVRTTTLSIFRSRSSRLWSPGEEVRVTRRRLTLALQRLRRAVARGVRRGPGGEALARRMRRRRADRLSRRAQVAYLQHAPGVAPDLRQERGDSGQGRSS